jgi:hypothetical protein
MGSRRTLAAYVAGVEVTYQTSAAYDTAGLLCRPDGTWFIAEHGFSADAVARRTRVRFNRIPGAATWEVKPLWEATAPVIREYFGHHMVFVESVYREGSGWERGLRLKAGRAQLRRLAAEGAVTVAVRAAGSARIADFQMSEITRSLASRKKA